MILSRRTVPFMMLWLALAGWSEGAATPSKLERGIPFELNDQYGQSHQFAFPRTRLSVLVLADREGSDQLEDWISPLYLRYLETIDIWGVAQLEGAPGFMRPLLRALFRKNVEYPVLLDWSGEVCKQYLYEPRKANVLLLGPDGAILHRVHGEAGPEVLQQCILLIDRFLRENGITIPAEALALDADHAP